MNFYFLSLLLKNYRSSDVRIKLYHFLRLSIFPLQSFFSTFQQIEAEFTESHSNIISIGCGYGTIETLLAILHPKLNIVGCDISKTRITTANKATDHISNLSFIQICATSIDVSSFDTVICNDILHHLEETTQIQLLKKITRHNIQRIVIKDVDLFPYWKYIWSYLHDFLVSGYPLNYKSSLFFRKYLENAGFTVIFTRVDSWQPYNHYIIFAHKTSGIL